MARATRGRNRSNYARKDPSRSPIDQAPGWVSSAPGELIIKHGTIGQGREVLAQLLKDPRMNRPWRQIGKRIDRRREAGGMPKHETYDRLWAAILSSLAQTNWNAKPAERDRRADRADKKEKCLKIERMATRLVEQITDSPLDVCVHHLRLWPDVDRGDRVGDEDWTPLRELLDKLALMARAQGTTSRVVQRETARTRANYFIRELAPYFIHHLGRPMNAALAAIATVVLDTRASAPLADQDAKRALRHQKG
jgi:hypothetical protein